MENVRRMVAAGSPPAEFDTLLGAFEGLLSSDAGILAEEEGEDKAQS